MKALVVRVGRVYVEEVPIPQVDDNEVLVASIYSAVSVGTEVSLVKSSKKRGILYLAYKALTDKEIRGKALDMIRGLGLRGALQTVKQASEASSYGAYLGYSLVGYVVAVGKNVKDINIGDIVACGGAEYAHHAEVVSVPRNLVVKVPPNVDLAEAAFTTIGSIALHALRLAEIQPGSFVAIIGTGLIGLIAVQLAKNVFSCRAVAVDVNDSRLRLASELGADLVINIRNISDDDAVKKVLEYTSGIGVDAAIVAAATRSSRPVNLALKLVRSRGRVVVVGDVGMNIDRNLMYLKEATVIVSRSYGPGRYDPLYEKKGIDYPIDYVRWTLNRNMEAFLDFLAQKKISLKPLISKIVSIDEAPRVYEELLSSKANYVGIVIKFNYEKYIKASREDLKLESKIVVEAEAPLPKPTNRFSKPIKVAVIGAGSFASQVLIPLIKELSEYYKLVAIVTRDPVECREKAERFKASYCSTDPLDVIYSNNVDMVVIATRHDTHAKFTIEAIKAGKAVFVEKPLALTEDELNEIIKVYMNNPVPITVDFNRRFSPYAIKARQIIEGKGPIFALYRVNAGMLPPTHWVQDPEVGGGRIIGEVCHFIDFFNYLLQGANLNSIKVDFILSTAKGLKH